MPIFEYQCPRCGKKVEQLATSLEKAVNPTCKHEDDGTIYAMQHIQFSKPGEPQFRGSGFYVTDYKERP